MAKPLIRLSKSCLNEADREAVWGVLEREFLGMGAEVQKFETELSQYFDRPALCVVNGTGALQLALQACGIGVGDEVLVQSLTYVASFQAISATGARPVACDVNLDSVTIDIQDAEKRLTSRTKAIIPVHYAGGVGQLDEIYAFAQKHKLRVIEDAAHAFGTKYKEQQVGSFGDIACFSFDGIKNITSGEGGCIVTADSKVLDYVKDARLLGVEHDTEKRFAGQRSWHFDVKHQGWRYHMSNVMAAIGLSQLNRFSEMAFARQKLARCYDKYLKGCARIQFFSKNYDEVVPHIYPIMIQNLQERETLRARLLDDGIQTGFHYQPNHELSFYKDTTALPFFNTDYLSQTLLTLPLHPNISIEDVEYVCEKIIHAVY